jgi:hypothetical protein
MCALSRQRPARVHAYLRDEIRCSVGALFAHLVVRRATPQIGSLRCASDFLASARALSGAHGEREPVLEGCMQASDLTVWRCKV